MAEPKFVIDGADYEIPGLDTFDMGEAMILHEYSGLTIDQIEDLEGLHPGVVSAFMHVAYQRKHRSMRPEKVKQMIRQTNLTEALEQFGETDEEEDADDPTARSSEPRSVREAAKLRIFRDDFWWRFNERFGGTGRRPESYWDVRIGHVAHLRPGDLEHVTPGDLLAAVEMFDALYPDSA